MVPTLLKSELQQAEAIQLGSLRRYLAARGWVAIPTQSEDVSVYRLRLPESDEIDVLLPKNIQHPHALRRIAEALRTLSQVEDQSLDELVLAIRAVHVDVIMSTIPDGSVQNQTVSLKSASGFISKMHALLVSAATTEIAPSSMYERTRKEARDYADSCRFGHTFRGSFGFTVESPIPSSFLIKEDVLPFERRVMQRLLRGLRSLRTAAAHDDPAIIYKQYTVGFSANTCERLIELVQEADADTISFGFVFSPEVRSSGDIGQDQFHFDVGAVQLALLEAAGKVMRDNANETPVVIQGYVTQLRSESGLTDLFVDSYFERPGYPSKMPRHGREITVQWKSAEFGELNVKVALNVADYIQAVDAHKQGSSVAVRGFLVRKRRSSWLYEPSEFRVLS